MAKKEIKKREGFFKLFHRYNKDDGYKKRKEELEREDIKLEKNDGKALFLASFLTLFLPAILILAGLIALALWVFGFFR